MTATQPAGDHWFQQFLDRPGSSPTGPRIALATELRRRRTSLGISAQDAAGRLRCHLSKISRMELGQVPFKRADIAALSDLYGVRDEGERAALLLLCDASQRRGWWYEYNDLLPKWFQPLIGLEETAYSIRGYEVQFVPGLLQTPEYAEAVTRLGHPLASAAELDRRVEVRMKRRELLTRADAPEFWAVLDEAVLWRSPNGPRVMREQLRHLLEASLLPNVTVQVAPFDAGGLPSAGTPVTLLRFPFAQFPDMVYVENLSGAVILDKPEKVEPYRSILDQLSASAETPRESRRRIERAIRRYR